ncbi:pleckstrin homology domain-containing family A member 7 isoform X3 [Rhineura floridana]|uniref:pleckstrin homology domain-containing family A member 7 isoform X3 n=1 Tax=Rhineura floridana TaxID=261503 RepID=UPI002AC7F5A0|nr:pleckstrin homology domain-containing family A member 7 isoform X3 [Rhineura floridana]
MAAAAESVGRDTLPEHWTYGVCRDGRVFFIDDLTRSTTWLHPRTGEPVNSGHMIRSDLPRGWEEGFSEEGASYFIEHNSLMPKHQINQRPSSMVSETSTAVTTSTVDIKPGSKVVKSGNKIHSFGKRDHAIRRNPNVPVVVRGWLHKQDSSGMRLWKRRWFVLTDYCLFYYKDSREESVLGSIPLPSYVISTVGPEDHINRKYSFKAVHTGMRAYIYNKSSVIGSQAEHSGMRTYYFSADSQEDMNGWIRAMNQATLMQTHSSPKRETRNPDQQAVPQANHVDACKECAKLDSADAKGSYRKSPEASAYDKREEMRKAIKDEHYAVRKYTVESKRKKSKHPSIAEVGTLNPESSLSQSQTAQPIEKNGMLSNSLNTSTVLVEQNGINLYKRFVSRPTPNKQTQRKNNMAHIEHWVKVQKGDAKSLATDQTLIRQVPSHSVSFPENYHTLPKNTRQSSGSSPPSNQNLPSDYKYAQDRVSHLKMSLDERRANKDGTVWQLYEWQQRQQFKHGSPTAPIYIGSPDFTDHSKGRSSLEVPRSVSVPPSPSDIPPPGPPKIFPPRRPHTPAERVTVKPSDERQILDVPFPSPRKILNQTIKNSAHIDRRSMPTMGYMTHTVSAPSLHGKSADDTYIQLKKDLEYLDLKVTGRDTIKERNTKPIKIGESDIDVKLSVLCEQDRILQDLEDTIRALKENKAYGWLVNFDKSHLQPTQRLLHLGAMLDTLQAMVFLAPDRITAITSIARSLMQQTSADVMLLTRALGMFISTIHIVPWARAHTRPLQWILLPFQKDIASSNHRKVRLSPALRLSYRWWTKVQHLSKGTSFREPRRTVVTTDASLIGWGAHCNSQYVQGVWSNTEQSQSINWLELKAVHLALCHFQSLFPLHHVLIRTDNMCVKSHLNRQGGTRSRPLQDLASLIFVWAEQHLQSLKAEHLRGIWNVTADWLSRQQVFPGEWKLHPAIFHRLQCRFGALSVDLFASSRNCRLPRYFARYLDSTAEAVDALTTPWPDGLLYAFPPIPLLAKTLRKARTERAQLVLVAPFWPRRPWFSDLLAMSMVDPWTLPVRPDLLSQGPVLHQDPTWFNLTAWRLNGDI